MKSRFKFQLRSLIYGSIVMSLLIGLNFSTYNINQEGLRSVGFPFEFFWEDVYDKKVIRWTITYKYLAIDLLISMAASAAIIFLAEQSHKAVEAQRIENTSEGNREGNHTTHNPVDGV